MRSTTSSTPWPRSHSSMYAMNGRSTSGTTGFGTVEVSGRSRVPSPPTRITACTTSLPPWSRGRFWHPRPPADALVLQAGGEDGCRVERVAPVDHEPARHRGRDLAPVQVEEVAPLGHEHDRVGVAHAIDRRGRELHAGDQLARLLLGD